MTKLPDWVIPKNVDREQLRDEVKLALDICTRHMMSRPTGRVLFICQVARNYRLRMLSATVDATLQHSNYSLETNLGIKYSSVNRKALRVQWLQLLLEKIESVSTHRDTP